MSIFRVSRKTIYNWLTIWEYKQIKGLYNQLGRGRKSKLNQEQQEPVKAWVKSEPKSLKKVKLKINKEWQINISKETIKRIIKRLNMKWKRMKRGMSKTHDECGTEVKIPRLEELKEQAKKGDIYLRY